METSTVDEIRARFDADVERFSNLDTGQVTAIDSPLGMELCAELAVECVGCEPRAVLDLGCGAGNYTLRFLQRLAAAGRPAPLTIYLNDLSLPMLQRAEERLRDAGFAGEIKLLHQDLREIQLLEGQIDAIMAASVLHHLRDDAEWDAAFAQFFRWLRPGGGLFVYDLVSFADPSTQAIMDRRYADYLEGINGSDYRDHVLAYIAKEDTPRPVSWQMDRLRAAGFLQTDVVHANGPFAVYAAWKPK
jgi:tRNA (cmo5U34)-methyltransferase